MRRPVATEQAPPARPPKPPFDRGLDGAVVPAGDIRSTSPYLPLRGAVRRTASIVALIVVDLAGLVLGIYGALVLRWLFYEENTPLWGFIWKTETDWLPFLTVISVLVFWQAGLYAERERRAGFGRIVASLVLVGVITLVFAVGTGHPFGTYGLAPTAVVLTSIAIGLLRGSYDVVTGDLLSSRASAGARFSSARATGSRACAARWARAGEASTTTSSARSPRRPMELGCLCLASCPRCPRCSRSVRSTS